MLSYLKTGVASPASFQSLLMSQMFKSAGFQAFYRTTYIDGAAGTTLLDLTNTRAQTINVIGFRYVNILCNFTCEFSCFFYIFLRNVVILVRYFM